MWRSAIICPVPYPSIDYLVVGHITRDLSPQGATAGGTAAYAGLTAAALGLHVGAVTSFGADMHMTRLGDVMIHAIRAPQTTTFTNEYTPTGRRQRITGRAAELTLEHVPPEWRTARWVHLGPVANEVDPALATAFPQASLGLTPQGWFRDWDAEGNIKVIPWAPRKAAIASARAVVISLEDVAGEESAIKDIADACPLLVVTDGAHGARVYSEGRMKMVPAPAVVASDPTGAGDIFAAAFFAALDRGGDTLRAARFATLIATQSATRRGLTGVPSRREVRAADEAAA
jgi:sugar/nucleoside kinase (ribokinase family)